MTAWPTPQPWRGRVSALLGILLLALSLRAAVVAVPPLLGSIGPELGFTAFGTGLLAMLAPLVFAVSGILTPALIARVGLERTLVLAVLLAIVGQVLRALVGSVTPFLLLSAVALAGYGIGNVVLPPLIKRYFPDRMAVVTAGYVTLIAVGTAMSPQFAVPLAHALGWRGSIAFWTLASAVVLAPWIVQFVRDARALRTAGVDAAHLGEAPASGTPAAPGEDATPGTDATPGKNAKQDTAPAQGEDADALFPAQEPQRVNAWRSPVAWGLAIFLAGNSSQTYVYFTWLPPYLSSQGVDAGLAGSMLAYFAILGLPVSLLVPLWVPRLRHPLVAVAAFMGCWIIGHAGLYLAPTHATALWVTFAGLGQGTFAMALLMVNLRSRTLTGSAALSGFSQGLGYLGAGLVPLLFGVVRDATGGWSASFAMLGVCLVVMLIGAILINGPRKIEDAAAPVRQPTPR